MTYSITLTDLEGNSRTIDNISKPDITREHTALSDWKATVPLDLSLEEWRFSEVVISVNGEQIFYGFLETVDSSEKRSQTVISGRGVGKDLVEQEETVTYKSIAAWQAIQDFWAKTNFSATVEQPNISIIDDDFRITAASTASEWEDILELEGTDPVKVNQTDDQVDLLQTCFVRDAAHRQDNDNLEAIYNEGDESGFSNGSGVVLQRQGAYVEVSFDLDYTIPEDQVGLAVRDRIGGHSSDQETGRCPRTEFYIDDEKVDEISAFAVFTDWHKLPYYSGSEEYSGGDLEPGTHTVRIEAVESGRRTYELDLICLYDKRFSYNFDNTLSAQGYLAGPELFPEQYSIPLKAKNSPNNVNKVQVKSTWTNTDGSQALEVALEDGDHKTASNTDEHEFIFDSQEGIEVRPQLVLSRYGTRTYDTPKRGFRGHSVGYVTINITERDDTRIIRNKEFSGTHLNILQELHDLASYRFTIDHSIQGKEADSYPRGKTQQADFTVKERSRKVDIRGYANEVVVRGKRDEETGERPVVTKTNEGEVDRLGKTITYPITDPSIETLADADSKAESEVVKRSVKDRLEGSLKITAKLIEPGYSYEIPAWHTTLPLERVKYSEGQESSSGTLEFSEPETVALELTTTKKGTKNVEENV